MKDHRLRGLLKKRISENLKIICHKRGINQNELADKLGIPHASMQGYCVGKTMPNVNRVIVMAEEATLSIQDFIFSDKSPLPEIL